MNTQSNVKSIDQCFWQYHVKYSIDDTLLIDDKTLMHSTKHFNKQQIELIEMNKDKFLFDGWERKDGIYYQ